MSFALTPAALVNTDHQLPPGALASITALKADNGLTGSQIWGAVPSTEPALLLPFDQLFEVRVAAALRLWRTVQGQKNVAGPPPLSEARKSRLVLCLRAIDGRQTGANYRDLAKVFFGSSTVPVSGWKTHDLRDRTIRLVRTGTAMMHGGYRDLLVHPYRRRARR